MISLSKGVRTVGACVVLAATVTAVLLPHPLHYTVGASDDFPCPDSEAISPCVCKYLSSPTSEQTYADLIFDLVCENVTLDELTRAFNAEFPFTRFTSFILRNSAIPKLEGDVFQDIVFESIRFENNGLQEVVSGVLKGSYHDLQDFYMSEDDLSDGDFQWPLQDLASFTELTSVEVRGPFSSVSALSSASLTSVTLSLNITQLPGDTFTSAPALTTVNLTSSLLETIAEGTFKDLPVLETVDISHAQLTQLESSSLAFGTDNLTLVDLSSNYIMTIDGGAFEGIVKGTRVDLSDNLLEELPHDVFEPLLADGGTVDVASNPLVCGCDLAWIIYLDAEALDRLEGLVGSCEIPDIDMDTLIHFLKYQCSTPSPSLAHRLWAFFI